MQRPTTPTHPIRGRHAGAADALALALPGDWVRHAACGPDTAELFFPISNTGPAATDTQRAHAICAACPVQQHCLDDADATGQQHGIWGGLTDTERASRQRRTVHPGAHTAVPTGSALDDAVFDLIQRLHTRAEIAEQLSCTARDVSRARDRLHSRLRRTEAA